MPHADADFCAVAMLIAVQAADAQSFATEPAAHAGRPLGLDDFWTCYLGVSVSFGRR